MHRKLILIGFLLTWSHALSDMMMYCLNMPTSLCLAYSVKLLTRSWLTSHSFSVLSSMYSYCFKRHISAISIIVGLSGKSRHGSDAMLDSLSAGFAYRGILKPQVEKNYSTCLGGPLKMVKPSDSTITRSNKNKSSAEG